MGRVVVLGSLNQDLQLDTPRLPGPGETVVAGPVERRFGGKGANQAIAAARAGAPTLLIGRVGDDDAGHAYLDRLRLYGVGTDHLRVDADAPTGTAIVYLDQHGENMIAVSPGANARVTESDLDLLDDLESDDVLLLQVELDVDLVATAARRAASRSCRVIINLSPAAELAEDVLDLVNPVVVNEHEAEWLAASGRVPASLVVTRGAEGSSWGDLQVPAAPADVVDTTGAGDAYCGTLAARLCLGDPPAPAMRAAAAAGAECVGHLGAQPPLED